MSGAFRNIGARPPYHAPGGDAVVDVVIPVLTDFSK